MKDSKTILSVLHGDDKNTDAAQDQHEESGMPGCQPHSQNTSFLSRDSSCLFSDTYRASKIISIEVNNLCSPVRTKLGHRYLNWPNFTEDSW